MKLFKIGQKVKLEDGALKKHIMLRRYDAIFFHKFGTVIGITQSFRRHIPQFCMVKFQKGIEIHIVDLPSTLLREYKGV